MLGADSGVADLGLLYELLASFVIKHSIVINIGKSRLPPGVLTMATLPEASHRRSVSTETSYVSRILLALM